MGTVPRPGVVAAGAGNINDLQTCTYDESHIVSGGKYHAHLAKCRKVRSYFTNSLCYFSQCLISC